MHRVLAPLVVLLGSCLVGGCFEVGGQMTFKPDGTAENRIEIAMDKAVADEFDKAAIAEARRAKGKTRPKPETFAALCKKGLNAVPSDKKAATYPKAPTTTKAGVRGDKAVCTIIEQIEDPVAHYDAALASLNLPVSVGRFERLTSGDGYRYTGQFRLADLLKADGTIDAGTLAVLGMVTKSIPPTMTFQFSFKATRIENTDGVVSANGTTVTWTWPLAEIMDVRPDAPELITKADIYFR